MIKEACVGSYQEAKAAVEAGANRIELCENLTEGGTTPSYGTMKLCLETLDVPVFPMIRPRGGDFVYSAEELSIMEEDIKICKELGIPAVVFGILKEDNTVDFEAMKFLVDLAKPMEVTFHKAIDELENPVEVMPALADLGVTRILSSGCKPTALEGQDMLRKMMDAGKGKIQIVVAGKVAKENLDEVVKSIPSGEYHGKKIV